MTVLAVVVAAVAALAIGILLGRATRPALTPEPPPPPPAAAPPDPVSAALRDAVNHLQLGVVVSDTQGRIVYRNRAAAMDNTSTGVLIGDHVHRLIERAAEGTVDEVLDLHGPPKQILMLVAAPLPDGGCVVTIQDVSERARIDAMRTDFVANISHELKTPVGAIAVLAETILEEDDPAVINRVSQRMIDEANRAVRAIDDLLELSWIEHGTRTDEVVELGSVVKASIARGRVADTGRRISVSSLEIPDVRLRADRRQLVSAIGNLVENGVKYSHDGGDVQVRSRVDDTAVEVMVVDQGVGIPTRDLDRVFERFYRVDKARSRETGGTGLGLAIVRHVATNHGGEVLVSSTEGEGSTFVFRLPASLVEQPDEQHDPTMEREETHSA